MKIIIFGATGTGKTTLGNALSKKLKWPYLDSDDYYWKKTNPPFQTKIPLEVRNKQLKTDFKNHENVIVSGSLCTWNKSWDTAFDLGIFLTLPLKIRMERLLIREKERYGEALNTDPIIQATSIEFLEWAATYDDEKTDGANLRQHTDWIAAMDCPVINLKGDLTTDERILLILEKIENLRP